MLNVMCSRKDVLLTLTVISGIYLLGFVDGCKKLTGPDKVVESESSGKLDDIISADPIRRQRGKEHAIEAGKSVLPEVKRLLSTTEEIKDDLIEIMEHHGAMGEVPAEDRVGYYERKFKDKHYPYALFQKALLDLYEIYKDQKGADVLQCLVASLGYNDETPSVEPLRRPLYIRPSLATTTIAATAGNDAIPYLLKAVAADNSFIRKRAAVCLAQVGNKTVVEPLVDAYYRESDWDAARAIEDALISLSGTKMRRTFLAALANYGSLPGRETGLLKLAQQGDRLVFPGVLRVLKKRCLTRDEYWKDLGRQLCYYFGGTSLRHTWLLHIREHADLRPLFSKFDDWWKENGLFLYKKEASPYALDEAAKQNRRPIDALTKEPLSEEQIREVRIEEENMLKWLDTILEKK